MPLNADVVRVVGVDHKLVASKLVLAFLQIVRLIILHVFLIDDSVPGTDADAGHADVALGVLDAVAIGGQFRDSSPDDLVEGGSVTAGKKPRILRHPEETLYGGFETFFAAVGVLVISDYVDQQLRLPEIPSSGLLKELNERLDALYLRSTAVSVAYSVGRYEQQLLGRKNVFWKREE